MKKKLLLILLFIIVLTFGGIAYSSFEGTARHIVFVGAVVTGGFLLGKIVRK